MNYAVVQIYCLPGTPKTENGLMPAKVPPHTIGACSFLKLLTKTCPVTTAGDEGSITVWYDPTAKKWRGERHRFQQCVDSIELPSRLTTLRAWVEKVLKQNRGEI